MATITLSGMHFYAHHGCFAEEQHIGTHFSVNVVMQVDTSRAEQTDEIADTVSYLDVYQVVKHEMEKASHLLEHVAGRTGQAILDRFPEVQQVAVEVRKLNPPLGGEVAYAGVSVEVVR